MPWKVERDESACSAAEPWALKKDDGEVVACHTSEEMANRQMAALYANEPEARNIPFDQVEARSVAFTDLDVSKGGKHFDGYAGIYGQEVDLGRFIEVMVPPAFRSALSRTQNLPMLWHHNETLPPFATTGAGTLHVQEDSKGLRVKATIDERHLLGPTLMAMVERGEVKGMSVGFITALNDNKISYRNKRVLRTITGFKKLLDVSPTWEPAYEGTSAELRSLTEAFQQVPVLVPEQIPEGESQQQGDGQNQETTEEPEEQRSGVDAQVASAARRRRLQLLGIVVPS